MIDPLDIDFLTEVGKWGVLPACGLWAINIVVNRLFATRTGVKEHTARVDILNGLVERVAALEKAQAEAWNDLQEERNKRREAEAMVDALTRRVSALEMQLVSAGLNPV